MTKAETWKDAPEGLTAIELGRRRLQAELVIACDEYEAIQARFDKVLNQQGTPNFALMRDFCQRRSDYLKAKRKFEEFEANSQS